LVSCKGLYEWLSGFGKFQGFSYYTEHNQLMANFMAMHLSHGNWCVMNMESITIPYQILAYICFHTTPSHPVIPHLETVMTEGYYALAHHVAENIFSG